MLPEVETENTERGVGNTDGTTIGGGLHLVNRGMAAYTVPGMAVLKLEVEPVIRAYQVTIVHPPCIERLALMRTPVGKGVQRS